MPKNMKNLIDTRKNIVYNKNKRRRHRYGKGTIAENRSSLCVVPELERNGREYDHPASAGRWVSGGNEKRPATREPDRRRQCLRVASSSRDIKNQKTERNF